MNRKTILAVSLSAVLASMSGNALASGFQLFEYNGAAVGNFNAGGAAEAMDASTNFANAAGLTRIHHKQIVGAADAIYAGAKFTGTLTQQVSILPGTLNTFSLNQVRGGGMSVVPSGYYAQPLNDSLFLGFGVNAPFGLTTNYGDDTALVYSSTKSAVKTINISPSLAVKINDKLSIGGGVDVQYMSAELNGVSGIITGNTAPVNFSENSAHDWSPGWHSGILFEATPETRFGLAYRSVVRHKLKGHSELIGPLSRAATGTVDVIRSNDARADIDLPATWTASVYHDVDNKFSVMGSVNYTQWDSLKEISLRNVAAVSSPGTKPITNLTVTIPQNFKNTWRVAGGASYKLTNKLTVTSGVGYDQTPTNNADRNTRLPDGNRIAVAVGANVQASKNIVLSAGWQHLFIKDGKINVSQVTGGQTVLTQGHSKNQADVFGFQVTANLS